MSLPCLRAPRRLRAAAVATALSAACALAAAGPAAASDALFVSGTAGNDAKPCSWHKPCATIGHAVGLAHDGTTIFVGPGTYREQVTVTTSLALRGFDAVIDASGKDNGIVITGASSAGSSVRGFTVENANAEGILANATSDLRIARNELRNNDRTPNATSPPQCAAQGEVPGDCGEALHLMGVTSSKVVRNFVHDNVGGILLTDETGPTYGNVVARNLSRDNDEDCGITLPSHNALGTSDPSKAGVYDNTIIHNVAVHNGGAGVGMFAPFPGTASYNNRVIGNILTDNGEAGIGIHAHAPGQDVSGNVIVGNFVARNGVDPDADSVQTVGIALLNADPKTTPREVIAGNRISEQYFGIFVNGSFDLRGLFTNDFASSVTTPVGHHA
jgi:hypothetical protein